MVLQLISSLATFLYGSTIAVLYYGVRKKTINFPHKKAKSKFSVVVAFRDEEANIEKLFESLLALTYPLSLFEVIAVNDHSSDASVALLQRLQIAHPELSLRILDSPEPYKKAALTFGISKASHPWIVTTDADCSVPSCCLQQFNTIICNTKTALIAGPVESSSNGSFLEEFQRLDFLSLQGTTMGVFGLGIPFLCNGANMCYKKAAFERVQGFEGNQHIASGDDVFLLEKIAEQYPKGIHYAKYKESCVKSSPQKNWKSLLSQRMRWAAKSSAYSNPYGIAIGCIVFAFNTLLVVLLITRPSLAGLLFVIKGIIDYVFLKKTAAFFQQKIGMQTFVLSALLYPFFSSLVFIASQLGTFTWKGRTLKK